MKVVLHIDRLSLRGVPRDQAGAWSAQFEVALQQRLQAALQQAPAQGQALAASGHCERLKVSVPDKAAAADAACGSATAAADTPAGLASRAAAALAGAIVR